MPLCRQRHVVLLEEHFRRYVVVVGEGLGPKCRSLDFSRFFHLSPFISIYILPTHASNALFLSDERPTLETLDFTIRIGSTPTFFYFDLYLYSAYAARYVYYSGLPLWGARVLKWAPFLYFFFFSFRVDKLQYPDRLCETRASSVIFFGRHVRDLVF